MLKTGIKMEHDTMHEQDMLGDRKKSTAFRASVGGL